MKKLKNKLARENIITAIKQRPNSLYLNLVISKDFKSLESVKKKLAQIKKNMPDAFIVNTEKYEPIPLYKAFSITSSNENNLIVNKSNDANEVLFNIDHFEVSGNSLVSTKRLREITQPHTGKQKNFGDLQKAIERIEEEYQKKGFSAVYVFLPEQELNGGTVTVSIIESRLTKISVEGNQHHSEENILHAIPQLKIGMAPNLKAISQNTQLSNENTSKNIAVTLAVTDVEGAITATVKTQDEKPDNWIVTADNSGNRATGEYRTGAIYQHNNLFNKDHTLTFGYTTSPNKASDVKIYSAGYRIPLYSMGDSIDLMCGYSDVTGSQNLNIGAMNFVGKGTLCAAKYNWLLERDGEVSSRFIMGLDYKAFDQVDANVGGSASTVPAYTLRPINLGYLRQWQQPGMGIDLNLSASQNMPGTGNSDATTINAVINNNALALSDSAYRYRTTSADYRIYKASLSLLKLINTDWMWRNLVSLQRASDPLVNAEQMGVGGAISVRGLPEREFGLDDGLFVSSELTFSDIKQALNLDGNLRPAVFIDHAQGNNQRLNTNTTQLINQLNVTSAGFGLRYNLGKDFMIKADLARVLSLNASTISGNNAQGTLDGISGQEYQGFYEGSWRLHASLMARF